MFTFVVKPLGTCRGWGSSRSVALLSAPPEAQCAAPGGPHLVAPHSVAGAGAFFLLGRGAVSIAGAEGGPLEGTGYVVSGGHSGRVSGPSRGSPQLRRPLGEPSVRYTEAASFPPASTHSQHGHPILTTTKCLLLT
ncbi:unnamed protein product [Pleuronectes platessa]|uniref:Uncharacterized protein n=1 Tax=Pleuronectes platessa TaxID=8262 RepID=A0A9N7YPJ3_PLEPL|nr:unnamed protein product [Pleuronectes platessa]